MNRLITLLTLLLVSPLWAADIALTVEEYDGLRQRASILVKDNSMVPLGTILRIHSKTGTCQIRITEQVNDHLIGMTTGCETGVIIAGMNLAYSPAAWEAPRNMASEVTTSYDTPDRIDEILQRTTVHVGHNFSRQLEGNVYGDSRMKNLTGDTALSFGVKGRVYDFTDRISLATELAYETPRTLDQATFVTNSSTYSGGTIGYSPRLSLWSLAAQGEAKLIDGLIGFAGLNFSIPSLRNSPFRATTDLGFQAGANYQILPRVAIEGLIKITNMNLKNDIGQQTDVSLAGLELRGRFNF